MFPVGRTVAASVLVLAMAIATRSLAQSTGSVPVLVSADWLAAQLAEQDLVVIAVGMQRASYDSAHVPGARFLPYGAYAVRRNGLTTELPPLASLDSTLESIGVSDRSRIIIYGPAIISHRLFLALDVSGFRGRVGILNGGLEAWRTAGRAITADVPTVRPGSVTLRPVLTSLVDRGWVRSHLTDSSFQFVDARGRPSFDAVRLPGAASAPSTSLLARGGNRDTWSLVPSDSLRSVLVALDPKREAVAYCAIGETASVLYWVLRSLDRPVRLYDGSLEDWSADPSVPVERGAKP